MAMTGNPIEATRRLNNADMVVLPDPPFPTNAIFIFERKQKTPTRNARNHAKGSAVKKIGDEGPAPNRRRFEKVEEWGYQIVTVVTDRYERSVGNHRQAVIRKIMNGSKKPAGGANHRPAGAAFQIMAGIHYARRQPLILRE
jgi:hypothetical protein